MSTNDITIKISPEIPASACAALVERIRETVGGFLRERAAEQVSGTIEVTTGVQPPPGWVRDGDAETDRQDTGS